MNNSDDITVPLTADLPAAADAPTTQPLLSQLLADLRALADNFTSFQTEVRARWAADDARWAANQAFQTRVEDRLDRIEAEQERTNQRLSRVEAKLNVIHRGQLDLQADDLLLEQRVTLLEKAA